VLYVVVCECSTYLKWRSLPIDRISIRLFERGLPWVREFEVRPILKRKCDITFDRGCCHTRMGSLRSTWASAQAIKSLSESERGTTNLDE